MKVKVISLPYIFQVLFVLCFTRPRYQVSVYRTIGPLVFLFSKNWVGMVGKMKKKKNSGLIAVILKLSENFTVWFLCCEVEQSRSVNNGQSKMLMQLTTRVQLFKVSLA